MTVSGFSSFHGLRQMSLGRNHVPPDYPMLPVPGHPSRLDDAGDCDSTRKGIVLSGPCCSWLSFQMLSDFSPQERTAKTYLSSTSLLH